MTLTEEIKSNESLAGNKKKEIGSLETIMGKCGKIWENSKKTIN